jgi:diguanylate cyclase (GGDEF)-like protein
MKQNATMVDAEENDKQETPSHLKALDDLVSALSRSLSFEQQLDLALSACREAMGADAVVIYLLGGDPQQLTLACGDGFAADTIALLKKSPLAIGQGELAQVAVDGQPRVIADLRSVPAIDPELTQREQVISGAFVPLRDAQFMYGVLGVYTRTRRQFTEADIRLLTSLASQVGLSLHNARLHEQMRVQEQTDALTGLFNRGHLMDLAEREYQRARRRRSPLIVLMIDVNQVKSVYDAPTHPAGDHALRAVARMLRGHTRTFDLVGRYGGDKIVVLLVDCTHAYAFQIIRRLHQAAQIIRVPPDTNRMKISLSIGMAACRHTENETLELVLAQAEREMDAVRYRED